MKITILAVFIQTVLRHRDQDGLLKIHFVEPAIIDCNFCGSSAVEGVEKLRIFQKHCFFVIPARHSVIDIQLSVSVPKWRRSKKYKPAATPQARTE